MPESVRSFVSVANCIDFADCTNSATISSGFSLLPAACARAEERSAKVEPAANVERRVGIFIPPLWCPAREAAP